MEEIFDDSIDGKRLTLVRSDAKTDAVVWLHALDNRWQSLLEQCRALGCAPFHLALVSGLDWDADLSPWPCPPMITRHDNFAGSADAHLQWLVSTAMPVVHNRLRFDPCRRVLAGYSMAGLFALYAIYGSDLFDAVASASGSVWYPDFVKYATHRLPKHLPQSVYLSIGDREDRSRNEHVRRVIDHTRTLAHHYRTLGCRVTLEVNPGNHFRDLELRMARAITISLQQLQS